MNLNNWTPEKAEAAGASGGRAEGATRAENRKRGGKARPLRVLIVEDLENDALLLELELQRAGYETYCRRVDTPEAMLEALEKEKWDAVVADYVMPHFSGLNALALVKERGLDLPFIIVSGHINEDTAVAAMKAGAHDYVMKDNLARLGPAVERELREAEVRREQRETEESLKKEHAFREAIENSVPSGIAVVDLEGKQTYVNPAFSGMVGWPEEELVGARPPFAYWPPEDIEQITDSLAQVIRGEGTSGSLELRFRRRSQEYINVLLQITPLKDNFGNITGWVSSATDITARTKAETRLAAEHAITRILANAPTFDEAAPGIMQVLIDGLEVEIGTLWLMDPKRPLLHPSIINLRHNTEPLQDFVYESRRQSFARGEGFPGRVWDKKRPLWVTDLLGDEAFDRKALAARATLRTAIAFPIAHGPDFFGVLEFYATRHMESDQTLVNMINAISSEIGQFIKRRAAEEALRRAHDELEMRVQQRTAELKRANASLQKSIRERKRLEHELLEITEKERRRIGLDLHDDLGQRLSGVALMLKGLQLKLEREKNKEAEEAGRIHSLVQEAMNHTSDLAHDLATLDLDHKDLTTALSTLTGNVEELFGITCQFQVEGTVPSLESNTVRQVYKIAQEAVTNAIKHGKADKVTVRLQREPSNLLLTVRNNGKPFPDLRGKNTGMGLRIMNYRASLVGAELDIKGLTPNGTRVSCLLPIQTKRAGKHD